MSILQASIRKIRKQRCLKNISVHSINLSDLYKQKMMLTCIYLFFSRAVRLSELSCCIKASLSVGSMDNTVMQTENKKGRKLYDCLHWETHVVLGHMTGLTTSKGWEGMSAVEFQVIIRNKKTEFMLINHLSAYIKW